MQHESYCEWWEGTQWYTTGCVSHERAGRGEKGMAEAEGDKGEAQVCPPDYGWEGGR